MISHVAHGLLHLNLQDRHSYKDFQTDLRMRLGPRKGHSSDVGKTYPDGDGITQYKIECVYSFKVLITITRYHHY